MNTSQLRSLLGWCSVLNFGLILFVSMFFLLGLDWVYGIQSKFLLISKEDYNALWFIAIGVWKILVLVFNLIPYIALRIMGKAIDPEPTVLP